MLTTEGGVEIEEVAENNPDALVAAAHRSARGLPALAGPPADLRRRHRGPERAEADPQHHRPALPVLRRVRRDALRDQPADRHARGRGAARSTPSSRSTTTRCTGTRTSPRCATSTPYPPEERLAREKDVTYVKLDGEVGILGNGAGLVMSTLDVIALAGGRPANFCDLGGGGDAEGRRRRARGHHLRPAGQVHPVQHLRRDHALRRGRARDPRRRSTGCRSTIRSSSGSTGRTPRRGGGCSRSPTRRSTSSRRCWRRAQASCGAGRHDRRLDERAQAYRESESHARVPTSSSSSTGRGCDRARRRDRRRTRRAAAAARRASTVVDSRSRAGHGPDVDLPRRGSSLRRPYFDTVVSRIAPHHFDDVQAAVGEMARVAKRVVLVEDSLYTDEAWRKPRSSATRRTCATTPKTSGARSRRGRPRAGPCRARREAPRARAWLARTGCVGEEADRVRELLAHVTRRRLLVRHEDRARGKTALVAIIVDNDTRLVVQGLTGREGRFHGLRNRNYGTNVVAGVTPGKGGQDVEGIRVFNTVLEAVEETQANTSLVFVPGPYTPRRDLRGRRLRGRHGHRHRRARPRARDAARLQLRPGPRHHAHRPELPRRPLARQGERRDHPRRDLQRGHRSASSRAPGR